MTNRRTVILASTSRYRRELMNRLQLPFDVHSPDVDETPLPGEAPRALAERLALAKAQAVARRFPEAVVIGSDQVADLQGQALGKPGTHERAVEQLRRMRGQTLIFQTAVAVVCQATGFAQRDIAPVRAVFRQLDDAAIEAYLQAERIGTVVWATGFRRAYPWLAVPVLDEHGEIRHASGVTPVPGLYVLGLQFQRRRKSAFIDGVGGDAEALAAHMAGYLADACPAVA